MGARALMAVLPPGTVTSSRPVRGSMVPLRVDGAGAGACGLQWVLLGRVLSWEKRVCKPRAGMLLYLVNGHVDVRAGAGHMELLIWATWSWELLPHVRVGCRTPPDCWEHPKPQNHVGKDRTIGRGQRGAREDPCAWGGPATDRLPILPIPEDEARYWPEVGGWGCRLESRPTQAGGIWLGASRSV